jgi:hypothetical protein
MDSKKLHDSAPDNGGKKQKGTANYRRVPSIKVATLKRQMDGAEKRIIRLKTELAETNAIIRRKYLDRFDDKGNVAGKAHLGSAQVEGLRLKRVELENSLAIAKGECFRSQREYRNAVAQNIQVERKSVKIVREENRIRRESKKLLKKTVEILKQHGQNGGVAKLQALQTLSLANDVKAFRDEFDSAIKEFDPAHYVTISGVSNVKTEIIYGVMDELAENAGNEQHGLLNGGAQ